MTNDEISGKFIGTQTQIEKKFKVLYVHCLSYALFSVFWFILVARHQKCLKPPKRRLVLEEKCINYAQNQENMGYINYARQDSVIIFIEFFNPKCAGLEEIGFWEDTSSNSTMLLNSIQQSYSKLC